LGAHAGELRQFSVRQKPLFAQLCELLPIHMRHNRANCSHLSLNQPAGLSERDEDIIKAYLARRTLIEAFSEETLGE
jgi:hypothetical protein